MFTPTFFGSPCPLLSPFAGPSLCWGWSLREWQWASHIPSAVASLCRPWELVLVCTTWNRVGAKSTNQLADQLPWAQASGILFISPMAHKLWADNHYLHSLFLTWLLDFPGGASGKERICWPMQETQETQVRFLGWEDPLEEEMATLSSILAWRIPWTEEPGRL